MNYCSKCKSHDIDTALGQNICVECGKVLEENLIVSEVTERKQKIKILIIIY